MTSATVDYQTLKQAAEDAGQGHLFAFWNDLSNDEKDSLLNDVSKVDFKDLTKLIADLDALRQPASGDLDAPSHVYKASDASDEAAIGAEALKAGRVAAFLVAGGQGTRLGFNGPKGTFPVSPIEKRTLFQLQAEQIKAIGDAHGVVIPWYIMTSDNNHDDTEGFLAENNHFGLNPADVKCFKQAWVPALDQHNKIILDQKHELFKSPNGHGGSIKALHDSGALADMKSRGIDTLMYYQVDNVLIQICDPVFLGHHLKHNAEMSAKVLPKRNPEEKVGVYCLRNGEMEVIEYSDLSDEDMYAKADSGELKFNAGNIAIHVFNREFLERLNADGCSLPWHLASKAIPFVSDSGERVTPEDKNGTKFEMFVFDAVGQANGVVLYEGVREEDFSPVKNAEGEDSPATAVQHLNNLWGGWAEKAGYTVPRDDNGNVTINLEVKGSYAYDEAGFVAKTQGSGALADGTVFA